MTCFKDEVVLAVHEGAEEVFEVEKVAVFEVDRVEVEKEAGDSGGVFVGVVAAVIAAAAVGPLVADAAPHEVADPLAAVVEVVACAVAERLSLNHTDTLVTFSFLSFYFSIDRILYWCVGVFIAKGKDDAMVTKNLVPGESVYGEKRVSVEVRMHNFVVGIVLKHRCF